MIKKIVLIFSFVFILTSSPVISNDIPISSLDITGEINRIIILQNKFNNSKNSIERYKYSSLMVDYLDALKSKMEDIKKAYYIPALIMSTPEIDGKQ